MDLRRDLRRCTGRKDSGVGGGMAAMAGGVGSCRVCHEIRVEYKLLAETSDVDKR